MTVEGTAPPLGKLQTIQGGAAGAVVSVRSMKLALNLEVNAEPDRDTETEADAERVAELAAGLYREFADKLLIAAMREGMTVVLHED